MLAQRGGEQIGLGWALVLLGGLAALFGIMLAYGKRGWSSMTKGTRCDLASDESSDGRLLFALMFRLTPSVGLTTRAET